MSGPVLPRELLVRSAMNVRRLIAEAAADHLALSAGAGFAVLADPLKDCRLALIDLSENLRADLSRHPDAEIESDSN